MWAIVDVGSFAERLSQSMETRIATVPIAAAHCVVALACFAKPADPVQRSTPVYPAFAKLLLMVHQNSATADSKSSDCKAACSLPDVLDALFPKPQFTAWATPPMRNPASIAAL